MKKYRDKKKITIFKTLKYIFVIIFVSLLLSIQDRLY